MGGPGEYAAIEMSVADLRKHIAAAIDAAANDGRVTIVTHRGRRVAVVGPLSLLGTSAVSLADEVRRLHELTQQGVLTDDEFVAAKRKLFATD